MTSLSRQLHVVMLAGAYNTHHQNNQIRGSCFSLFQHSRILGRKLCSPGLDWDTKSARAF